MARPVSARYTDSFIYRGWATVAATVDTAANIALCTEIDVRGYSYGSVQITATDLTTTNLNYYGSHTSGGTYYVISGNTGTALTSVVDSNTAQIIEIPAAVFSCPFIKITSGADTTPVTVHLVT